MLLPRIRNQTTVCSKLFISLNQFINQNNPLLKNSYSSIYQRTLLLSRISTSYSISKCSHSFSTFQPACYSSSVPPSTKEQCEKATFEHSWLNKYLPSKLVPYVLLTRLDKPIGAWLLYLPCAWSITMASYHAHLPITKTIYMMMLFGTGAFIMRGAGCTINDLWDRNIDKMVERTRDRPLASGSVTPFQALTFLGLQLSAGLAILTQLNYYSILLGATSLSIVVVYPFMKRVTYWPQLYLGLAFNWGALLGWSAMIGSNDWSITLPLYGAGVCWTLVYDTIYAHQDKSFDSVIGVRSTALLFGNRTRQLLTFFSASMLSLLALSGQMNGQGWPFYLVSIFGTGMHLFWQLRTVNFDDAADCARKFRSNKWTGSLVLGGILADVALENLKSIL
ncbi:420_t:CDS:2 [Acaulospora morrowiae]|uniref:4-hydroxybenzoate polyprenyltransferase, mitochondrial n=1 Tax=Acaulospora morrowiae TaxID=94023 RepID=A0A9N9BMB1_9GLOM|nr:420_t:CDS:2 [Acaulospora morrowiae]